MDRAEHIRALQAEYAQRQSKNRQEADARLREAESRDPVIASLRARSSRIAMDALRKMMLDRSPEASRRVAEEMRREGVENNKMIRARLIAAGFSGDYLDERYACPKCRDTGYTDELPARFCECFERALRLRMFEDGTMAGLDEQNFDMFSEELVKRANSEEDAARIIIARNYCETFANEYPAASRSLILMYGPGGVGKTFLLNCMFARIVERGYSGVRITAYRMFEAMRKKHIGSDADAQTFDELIEAPLLMIDDLGTEPVMRSITVEYFFTLINERSAARRHTVIATNLNPVQLRERYGERVASRLLDKSRGMQIGMRGSDLRRV